jgi:superfamily I DNA/RNA helicase
MKHTPQQTDFIATAKGTGSVALKALAGTGKTYSLREWATATNKGGLATSFSKSTVAELSKKMPTKFQAKTMHALGFAALKSSGKFTELANSKIFDLTKTYADEFELPYEEQEQIRKLVDLGKTFGIQPDPLGPAGLTPDTPDAWESLADQFDIDLTPEILEHSRTVLQRSNTAGLKDGIIDFSDMLYLALLYPHRFPRFPVILADEVQDLNTLQHAMLKRLLLPGGRLISAGDPHQAIYGFRGALHDSYAALVKTFSMQELPLTVSFRCPQAVVTEAQRYVPDILPAPEAIMGEVIWPQSLDLDTVPRAVLCRNNAPLISLALSLLVSGRTVEVAGQDIGRGLVTLTKRITKRNLKTDEFLARLSKWKDREIERYPRRKARVMDKFLALSALASHHRDLKGIQDHLLKLYPDPSSRDYRPAEVHLSTIHRAKGREWPDVLFLDPQLLPSKYATAEWELTQENNLAYVGITRAQRTLTYCATENIHGAASLGDPL